VAIIIRAATAAGGDDRCGQSGKFLFLVGPSLVIFEAAETTVGGDDRCDQR